MKAHIITLQSFTDKRGTLVPVEAQRDVPFPIRRVYWIVAKGGYTRGEHAHRTVEQMFVVLHGQVSFETEEGIVPTTWYLETPAVGLYVPPMAWHRFYPCDGAVILSLASGPHEETEYIRDYKEWKRLVKA